ncbi:MAG: hypothetical protein KGH65_03700 [Candidatus Micrarchaeota archaeon]|nr:hypothetical protein [Candidatus Micrarchaeota archaeon]
MLALANRDGYVAASVPGLAHIAHVTRAEAENALYTLSQPDPDSRSTICEGRRIEATDGGWNIINYVANRDSWTDDDKREFQRKWIAEKRAKAELSKYVEVSRSCRSESTRIEPPAPAPTPSPKKERRATALPTDFGLTPERVAYASQYNVQSVQNVMEAFCNHHRAKGSTMKDWEAAWRTWVLREARYGKKPYHENVSDNSRKSDASILDLCKLSGISTHGKSRDELLLALKRVRP